MNSPYPYRKLSRYRDNETGTTTAFFNRNIRRASKGPEPGWFTSSPKIDPLLRFCATIRRRSWEKAGRFSTSAKGPNVGETLVEAAQEVVAR